MTARAELILGLRGNLVEGLRKGAAEFQRTQTIGQRSMLALSRTSAAAGRGIDRLGNRYAALAGGAAAVGASRFVVGHERRLTRLGNSAKSSADKVALLNQQVYETAQAPDIRADPSEILAAIEAIVEKTGDLDFAQQNMRNLALAIQATGAGGVSIGEMAAELKKLNLTAPDKVLRALDTLNVQGKAGSFTLAKMATVGAPALSAYVDAVRGMRDGNTVLTEFGAVLQAIQATTADPAKSATGLIALIAELQDPAKGKQLKRKGVDIHQMAADGTKALRPLNEVLIEINRAFKGDRGQLGGIFGREAINAFGGLGLSKLEEFMSVQGDGAEMMADSARAANDAAGALQNLSTAWKQFADINVTPAVQGMAEFLNSIDPETVKWWTRFGKQVAVVVALGIGLRKVFQFAGWAGKLLGAGAQAGTGGGAGGLGGGLGGLPLPLPVYVVNKRMSLMPGELGGKPGNVGTAAGGAAVAKASKLATAAKFAGGATIGGALGYAAGSEIYDRYMADNTAGRVAGTIVAHMAALIPGALGAAAREATGASPTERRRRDWSKEAPNAPITDDDGTPGLLRRDAAEAPRAQVDVGGVLRIQIDAEGRPRVRELRSTAPGFELDVYTGPMLSTP